jgi:hypothetical protein
MKRQLALILGLILLIVAGGFYVHTQNTDLRAPLAFGVIAPGLITFFWLLSDPKGSSPDQTLSAGILRKAIASSIVVEYLVLVGTFAFWGGATEALSQLTSTLVNSFTSIVGIVIAFYFGASAYLDAKTHGNIAPQAEQGARKVAPESPAGPAKA